MEQRVVLSNLKLTLQYVQKYREGTLNGVMDEIAEKSGGGQVSRMFGRSFFMYLDFFGFKRPVLR